jgi:hypothetical protein
MLHPFFTRVITRCKVSGSKEEVAAFLVAAFSERGGAKCLDFNKIIPMPKPIRQSLRRAWSHRLFDDEQAMGLLLLALNDTHGIVRDAERALTPNTQSDGGLATSLSDGKPLPYLGTDTDPDLSPLAALRNEVDQFLAGLDRDTGISSQPLSPRATRALLQTILSGPGSPRDKLSKHVEKLCELHADGENLWSEQDKSRHGPASLGSLAKNMMQLPSAKTGLDSGIFQLRIIAETGHRSWYEWVLTNWNTKRNAVSAHINSQSDSHIDFTVATISEFPLPVFEKLGEMFPEMKIWCACLKEDYDLSGWGYFTEVRGKEPGCHFDYDNDINSINKTYLLVHDEERPEYRLTP